MSNKESIEIAIDSIVSQIELLSRKCKLEDNRVNSSFEKTLEASSLMLQLSRTLSELVLINRSMEMSGGQGDMMEFLLHGRKKS